jgi:acetate---CoA ligase (ADP-forming)
MDLRKLFAPESMAVVGVSTGNDLHPANVIYRKNNLRYPVRAYAVNPRGGELHGETVYPGVSDIPETVDVAVIAVRAENVPDVVDDCIRNGVGGAAVISGGFAETGRTDLQDRLVSVARDADFPLIGPNCLGFYAPTRVDTFFPPSERMVQPSPGNVALVSQSGGILVDQMVKFAGEGIGLSLAVSIGNKAVIREMDLLGYLADDDRTDVIAFYVEGFARNEGRAFVLAACDCPKPVIVLKAGKSPGGSRAVSSHTASMAGDYRVFSSVLAQHGVVEAKNEYELVAFCEALSYYPRSIEGRVGIVTGSGGHGAIAVDTCASHGLSVPDLDDALQDAIRARLSPSIRGIASLGNPMDLTGSALDDDFYASVEHLSRVEDIDCILVLLLPYLPGITSDLGARLSQITHHTGKPIVAYVPHVDKYRMLIDGFELNRVPVSPSIEGAVHRVEAMRRSRPC